jgi:CubicO group peptidase (beta-lactamase class C family)
MLKAHDVPGAAVAFAERGSVSWVVGQGVAERSTGRAVTAETPFEAASLSKPAFACAVLRLCSLGALSLEAEVGDLLGDEDLAFRCRHSPGSGEADSDSHFRNLSGST